MKVTLHNKPEKIPEIRPGRKWRFPFPELVVGGHFIVTGVKYNMLSPYICYARKALGGDYKTKMTERGLECWRVK